MFPIARFARIFLLTLFCALPAQAFESFVIEDIRVEGLQRISAGTVFNYFPVRAGDKFNEAVSEQAIRALYKSGYFRNIQLGREGDVLVIAVEERPAISSIELKGNEDIETEPLLKSLKDIGFAEGSVFNRSLLEQVEQELQRQYFSRGKYGVRIETTVTPLERNRVAILIDVSEGVVAKIRQINIVGNTVFSDEELHKQFELSTPGIWTFYTKRDQYSKQKLAADIESMTSFYQDRGYIKFNVDSTQVSISPNKKDIYITINVMEGQQYKVSEIQMSGDFVVPAEELFPNFQINAGDVFSRKQVTSTVERISSQLGDVGFAFANVNTIPEIDEENKEVKLTFFIDPGKRVYVRRINFAGNINTRDTVLRQEMRQMEGGWYSGQKVERSRTRLQRLGFFEEVNVETPAVPEASDQVDVNYSVTEQPSGSLSLAVGFAQSSGLILSASISENNFMGTGKHVSIAVNNSSVNRIYNFSFTDPYYTVNGVSRGFGIFSRSTNANEANITDYTTDVLGGNLNYGIPINEFDTFNFGIDVEHLKVKLSDFPSDEIQGFTDEFGRQFTSLGLSASLAHDTRNRRVFPSKGGLFSITAESKIPGSELEFYKLNLRGRYYLPLTRRYVFSMNTEIGYGDGFGDFNDLPFFENYFSGGVRSVRGYEDNTLGPRDTQNDPLGGSFRTVGNLEIVFPPPFIEKTNSVRLSTFFDVGNVFSGVREFSVNKLRTSVGLSATWLSPVGPLAISLAKTLNDKSGDETQAFQFTLGAPF